jgi:hypothetical protein
LPLDLCQCLVGIHRVSGALIVFLQTALRFVEPEVCRVLVLAGIAPDSVEEPGEYPASYMARVFQPVAPAKG